MTAFWLEDGVGTIAARERAYRLYRAGGDRAGAARMAIFLAEDSFVFRSALAVANGWLRRAERLLAGLPPSFEHALLASEEGYIALVAHHDAVTAGRFGAEAAAYGRLLGSVDLEMHGLALEGLALVSTGEVEQGMACLDEATAAATGGEMQDPSIIGATCCYLIFACEWVRDYPRAAQWCERVKELCERWGLGALLGICRAHYASVLMWRGAWVEAEEQLAAAIAVLSATRPALAAEAMVRLAELRRRQGHVDESEALFARAPAHPLSLLGRAALALDRGDPTGALDWADRFLRRLPSQTRTERVAGLEVLVQIDLALGDRSGADEAVAALQSIATAIPTESFRAAALAAEGLVAVAAGDHHHARRCLDDAVDLYDRSGAPFETARARLPLARTLFTLGRDDAAADELRRAEAIFRELGATREAERAHAALRGIPTANRTVDQPVVVASLTPQEAAVLRLVARGLSNQEIATALVLSVRTVERHISTIYGKLGVRGKVARVVAGAYAARHGLT